MADSEQFRDASAGDGTSGGGPTTSPAPNERTSLTAGGEAAANGPVDAPGPADKDAQIAQLQAEADRLRTQLNEESAKPSPRRKGRAGRAGRTTAAIALLVIGCLLVLTGMIAVFARDEVLNTNRFVATVGPLGSNPQVLDTISTDVTNAVLAKVNVHAVVTQAVSTLVSVAPPKLQPRIAARLDVLVTPITSSLTNLIGQVVAKVVHSKAFAVAWVRINERAHTQVVNLLTGKQGGALAAKNGKIVLNLAPVITEVKQQLSGQGFGLVNHIPTVNAQLVLFKAAGLEKAQSLVSTLDTAANVLPWLALLFFAGAVAVAVNHRRILMWVGIGMAITALFLGLGLDVGREIYLNKLPSNLIDRNTGAIIFDQIVHFLRETIRVIFALGAIIAIAAFLSGPATAAVWTRRTVGGWLHALGSSTGVAATPFGLWVGTYKRWIEGVIVAVAAAIVIFWGHPTVAVIFVLAAIALLFVLLTELVGRPPQVQST